MDPQREQRLVRAAQQGDEQAFGELYDAYVDKIYRYILYRLSDPETARDLTGEVFLRVVKDLPRFQYDRAPLLAWLYRIAHARLVDYYRQRNRARVETSLDDIDLHIDDENDDLDSALVASYRQQQLYNALLTLTDEQQQVILLRFIEGHDLQQTADLLGKTIGAVKVMQHRAVQALARALRKVDRRDLGGD